MIIKYYKFLQFLNNIKNIHSILLFLFIITMFILSINKIVGIVMLLSISFLITLLFSLFYMDNKKREYTYYVVGKQYKVMYKPKEADYIEFTVYLDFLTFHKYKNNMLEYLVLNHEPNSLFQLESYDDWLKLKKMFKNKNRLNKIKKLL